MKDLNEIAKNSNDSYYYAKSLNFKNVPSIIIKSISKNSWDSYCYAEYLNFNNVPLVILKSAINCVSTFLINEPIPENMYLLLYIIEYDKRMNIIMESNVI